MRDKSSELEIAQVKTRTMRGLTLLVVREAVIKVIAIAGQLFLVRLLLPEYFGIIAVLSFLVNTADLFADVGLISGVIRNKERPSQELLSSLFLIKLVLTSAVVFILWMLRPVIAQLFPILQAEHFTILAVFSLTLLLRPLRSLIYGLLERELRYDLIPVIDIVGLIIYFLVAISLAVSGFGIWSLVWSAAIKDVVEVILLEIFHPFIPSVKISTRKLKAYLTFGAPVQGNTILGVIHQSTIPFLGGMLVSPAAVGYLDWGFNIASLPRAITANVGRIAFASFSRIQDRADLLTRAIEESIEVMSLIILFLLSASLFYGRQGIHLFLGEPWVAAAPSLTWLLAAELFLAIVGVLQQAIIARGLTQSLIARSLIGLFAQWLSVLIFVKLFGFVGIAIGICFGMAVTSLMYWRLIHGNGIKLSFRDSLLPQILVFLFSLMAGYFLSFFPSTPISFVIKITIFFVIYLGSALVFSRKTLTRTYLLFREHVFSW